MKKVILLIGVLVMTLTSCTQNMIARRWGGTVEINVLNGYKVTSATWKGEDLFYFIEPMEDGYVAKNKMFIEDSNFGIIESKVVFKERR